MTNEQIKPEDAHISRRLGWLAELDENGWHPTADTEIGSFPLDVWFETENECITFVRHSLLGLGLFDAR